MFQVRPRWFDASRLPIARIMSQKVTDKMQGLLVTRQQSLAQTIGCTLRLSICQHISSPFFEVWVLQHHQAGGKSDFRCACRPCSVVEPIFVGLALLLGLSSWWLFDCLQDNFTKRTSKVISSRTSQD